MLPQGYAYPAKMRATRDLLRRRMHFVRHRAELKAHVQMTADQYNLPKLPAGLSTQQGRLQIASHFPVGATREIVQLDLEMMSHLDQEIRGVELSLRQQAQAHDAVAFQLLKTVPGIGDILALVILYEIERVGRFPTVQKFASYARLVRGDKESGGKKLGKGARKMGNAYLKWAFSEAAVMFLRGNPEVQKRMEKLRSRYGKGKALSILAHKLGRVVYLILTRQRPFDMKRFMASF